MLFDVIRYSPSRPAARLLHNPPSTTTAGHHQFDLCLLHSGHSPFPRLAEFCVQLHEDRSQGKRGGSKQYYGGRTGKNGEEKCCSRDLQQEFALYYNIVQQQEVHPSIGTTSYERHPTVNYYIERIHPLFVI